jgi:hypothetical protein
MKSVQAVSIGLSDLIHQRTECDFYSYGVPGY